MRLVLSQFRQFLTYTHPARGVSRTVVSAFLIGFLLLALLPVDDAEILENGSITFPTELTLTMVTVRSNIPMNTLL